MVFRSLERTQSRFLGRRSASEQTYYQLYDATARALKAVNPRLRVGGPATAQAAWVDRFIRHCTEKPMFPSISFPLMSTETITANDVFGTDENIPRTQMVCRAVAKVHDQVKASPLPDLPSFSANTTPAIKMSRTSPTRLFMGPWLADTIRQCDGLIDMMSYWTFSDVFEEQGVVKKPFYGGYGLIAEDDLPKPAFNAFKLLHQLGRSANRRRFKIRAGHSPRGRALGDRCLEFVPSGRNRRARKMYARHSRA